ncbi:MAG: glycosyltransferase family 39 protein [Bacteroidetes bacterium]|nr:glycosyltransferase family 39 protein [Bacteroidota bacterium]
MKRWAKAILNDPIRHWPSWALLVLLIRLPLLVYFMDQGRTYFPERMVSDIVLKEVDYGYFLQPVDHYFEEGTYSFGGNGPYAGRMPGYAIPYFLLRLVLAKDSALVALILIQIVLSAISVCYLALLAYRLSRSKGVFLATLLFYGTSLYYLRYDFSSITEAPSVALFILSLYQLFSWWEDDRKRRLIWGGFFLTWTIFLRPFLGYLLLPIGLMLLIKGLHSSRQLFLKLRPALLFCLPFILIEGLWIARNYSAFGRFIPLETPMYESYGKSYSKAWLSTREFAASLDIETAYFEPGLAQWFRASTETQAAQFEMPMEWFEGVSFNRDSLEALRSTYLTYQAEKDAGTCAQLETLIVMKAERYKEEVKNARPWTYHVSNRLENIGRRVFTSGSSYVLLPAFDRLNHFQKFLKLYASACYYLVLFFGFIGLILMYVRSFYGEQKAFALLALIHCIALPLILPFTPATLENRYLFTLYPLLTIGMMMFFHFILSRLRSRLLFE